MAVISPLPKLCFGDADAEGRLRFAAPVLASGGDGASASAFNDFCLALLAPRAVERDAAGAAAPGTLAGPEGGPSAGTTPPESHAQEQRVAPAPDAATPANDGRTWRCLHAGHGANCTRCTAPPPTEAAEDYMLVGDKSFRSGEKKLRALLARSPEWCTEALRLASAEEMAKKAAAQLADAETLRDALRGRDTSILRKVHLIALCALWRYKCDVWVRRTPSAATMPRKRQRTDKHAAAQTRPQPACISLSMAPPDAATSALRCMLRSQLQQYVAATDDARSHAAALAEPGAPMLTWNAVMFDALLPAYRVFASQTASDALALQLRCDTFSVGGEAFAPLVDMTAPQQPAPRWLEDSREALLTRVDAHLLMVQRMIGAHTVGLRTLHAGGAAVSGPDRAISLNWADSLGTLAALMSAGQSAIAAARQARRSGEHILIAAEVAAALASAMRHMTVVHESRRDWCRNTHRTQALPAPLVGPDAAVGSFWPACLARAQGEMVPLARGVQPQVAGLFEAAVRAVLSGTDC